MKYIRSRIILLFILALMVGSGWMLHKFYVSLTEIRYNPASERFEISVRIFPDDLDHVLKTRSGISTQLATEMESPLADSLLEGYLQESFSVRVDGKLIDLTYLGKEPEADAIWCYLESVPVSEPGTIRVHSTLLTEEFRDQVNIIQVYVGDWNKGMMLNRDEVSGQLTVVK